ncbi:MAG: hypothetical protein WC750_04045 [Patescibacteria group bacterium]|jgi:hypothetical protein
MSNPYRFPAEGVINTPRVERDWRDYALKERLDSVDMTVVDDRSHKLRDGNYCFVGDREINPHTKKAHSKFDICQAIGPRLEKQQSIELEGVDSISCITQSKQGDIFMAGRKGGEFVSYPAPDGRGLTAILEGSGLFIGILQDVKGQYAPKQNIEGLGGRGFGGICELKNHEIVTATNGIFDVYGITAEGFTRVDSIRRPPISIVTEGKESRERLDVDAEGVSNIFPLSDANFAAIYDRRYSHHSDKDVEDKILKEGNFGSIVVYAPKEGHYAPSQKIDLELEDMDSAMQLKDGTLAVCGEAIKKPGHPNHPQEVAHSTMRLWGPTEQGGLELKQEIRNELLEKVDSLIETFDGHLVTAGDWIVIWEKAEGKYRPVHTIKPEVDKKSFGKVKVQEAANHDLVVRGRDGKVTVWG